MLNGRRVAAIYGTFSAVQVVTRFSSSTGDKCSGKEAQCLL